MVTSSTQIYNSPVNFFLAQDPPAGIKDPLVRGSLVEVYNGIQNLIQALVNNCGIGPQPTDVQQQLSGSAATLQSGNLNRLYVKASESIVFGALVNLHNIAGNLRVRNANATDNTKPADGYCSVFGGIAIGTVGEVQLGHGVTQFAGLVVGSRYFLFTANGLVSTVPAVAAGNIEQYIGVAITDVDLFINLGYWIQH